MKLNTLFKNLFYILLLTATTLNANVTYTHTDALGSVIAESDSSGKVIKSYHYAPYGESIPSVKNNNPGYTGHVYDNDLGLSYMKARYYDPEIGRFYSNDPVGFSANNPFSFNRYAYANNNPYKFVDPDGESPLLIFVMAAALTSYLNAPDVGQQPMSGMTPEAGVALTAAIPVEAMFSGVTWMAKSSPNIIGKVGEDAVKASYNIGKKERIAIHGRIRIPDGVTRATLRSEVKNVKKLSYTRQLRDFADIAKRDNLVFDLYVKPSTQLTKPLVKEIKQGNINLKLIPGAK